MDILIPLASGHYKDCIELKYALRSIETNLSNIGDIHILTDRLPGWITNVKHTYVEDIIFPQSKEWNIMKKLTIGAGLLNKFLCYHDDHYILQPMDAEEFPLHHCGMFNYGNRGIHDPYVKTIKNTERVIARGYNYDIHSPIIMEREFINVIAKRNWQKDFGYCIKTLYVNAANVYGTYYEDIKLYNSDSFELPYNRLYISTDHRAMDDKMIAWFENKFPGKSKWEKLNM